MATARRSRSRRDREKPSDASRNGELPRHQQDAGNGETRVKGGLRIKKAGESGRRGVHPLQFFRIVWKSTSYLSRAVNILWPIVPAAIAIHYTREGQHVLKFCLAYIAMVPCANLIGFAGQELSRKLPHMLGVLIETTIGSIVEIILFMVLLTSPTHQYSVIRAAILGSILANMLLCLGFCFFASGIRRETSHFHEAIAEVGSNLLLIAGLGLAIPTIFYYSLNASELQQEVAETISSRTTNVSRVIAILLLISYAVYIFFQMRTHHGLYDAIFEQDEHRDEDAHKDRAKEKLTLSECVLALAISVALVTFIAIALVQEIPYIVEDYGISDPFMGLILVPLVEKAAEHLTAIDEAWDNQLNFALSHVIGSTIQTAMFNAPLVVIVGWGLQVPMDFHFEIFDIAILVLAVITVGGFLRDEKSDYLEGFLCIIMYVAIAVAAFFYPNPAHH